MRSFVVLLTILAGCHSSKPAAAPAPAAPVANTTTVTWDQHLAAFMIKVVDVADNSGGDCEKLATTLEALAPEAKAVRGEMEAAHKKSGDWNPDDQTAARMKAMKEPGIFDRCEKASPKAHDALDHTLLVIAPIGDDKELIDAAADAFGKAMAPK